MAWNDPDKLRARFSFVCDVPLDQMSAREDGVRHCARCAKDVFPARSPEEFDARAREGVCVYAASTQDDILIAAPPPPPKGMPARPEPPVTAGIPYDPERFRREPIPEPPPPPPTPPRKEPRQLVLVGVLGGLVLGGGLLFVLGGVLGWVIFGG